MNRRELLALIPCVPAISMNANQVSEQSDIAIGQIVGIDGDLDVCNISNDGIVTFTVHWNPDGVWVK